MDPAVTKYSKAKFHLSNLYFLFLLNIFTLQRNSPQSFSEQSMSFKKKTNIQIGKFNKTDYNIHKEIVTT